MQTYYNPNDLDKFSSMGDEAPQLWEKFMSYYGSVFEKGALSEREKALIALAVAHSVQCAYCIDAYTNSCLENGADEAQMTEAVHVASAIRGGAALVHGVQMKNIIKKTRLTMNELESNVEPLEIDAGSGNIPAFEDTLAENDITMLKSNNSIPVMQMNIGKICNLSCAHCHVEAGPGRTELMSRDIMSSGLDAMVENDIKTLDITGGAPELNPDFTWLVEQAVKRGRKVMVRSNLTVLDDEKLAHIPKLLAENKVELVCSLPYYSEKDTDKVRGDGVFKSSVKILQMLNNLGYGAEGGDLILNLVYNPGGAFLPGAQQSLEEDFRLRLKSGFGITFNNLYAIGNFPVGRFLTFLKQSGNFDEYMEKLYYGFNPDTLDNVMCKDQISLSYDGYLYDCDFNQALGLSRNKLHISDCKKEDLSGREIATANHCYACTAGSGSSCGGAVV